MFKHLTKTVLTTTTLLFLATTSFAAVPGGPKPSNCPPGQIPVNKNGLWVCEDLKIQSGTSNQGTLRTPAAGFKVAPSRPGRAKPDLIVYSVEKHATKNNVVVVHVQNIGKSLSKNGMVSVSTASGAKRAAAMPDIKSGQIRLVYVNFRSPVKSGRSTTTADSTGVINESNEKNNVKYVKL